LEFLIQVLAWVLPCPQRFSRYLRVSFPVIPQPFPALSHT
jgi:hypothetical protein